jgi:hypothetical protein
VRATPSHGHLVIASGRTARRPLPDAFGVLVGNRGLALVDAFGHTADRSSCGMLESTTGTGRTLSKMAINRAAMGDPQYENHEFRVFDRVDNPVVTDPDPP